MKYLVSVLFFFSIGASAMQLSTSCASCSAPASTGNASAGATSVSSPTSIAGSNSGANNQTINFNQPGTTNSTVSSTVSGTTTTNTNVSGTETIKNVPSMAAPNLTTSNDTCMGSAGVGGAVAGFGISLGKTYTDDNCITWKSGIGFWNQGLRATAIARECQDPKNREALRKTGISCIWQRGQQVPVEYGSDGLPVSYETQLNNIKGNNGTAVATDTSGQPTDPFIRYRLGLPPLAGQENSPPYSN